MTPNWRAMTTALLGTAICAAAASVAGSSMALLVPPLPRVVPSRPSKGRQVNQKQPLHIEPHLRSQVGRLVAKAGRDNKLIESDDSDRRRWRVGSGANWAALCVSYLAGVVATELVVFDFGPPKAAFSFYSTSLPSLVSWPQGLRIALPMLGVAVGLLLDVGTLLHRHSRRSRRLRWNLLGAGLLTFPGLLSFVNAILAVRAFLADWSHPLGLHRSAAVSHLLEVRWWHTLMLATLCLCVFALRRADRYGPGRPRALDST
eukprot:TRINITY_DN81523_c0_g1_i1.p1 TRINITY_DN81523_c0_g1~~TRINITY_DN81523_c0_g1_i1.p1  ORF type:complete len:260 (+),score=19.10 TRINITY_DN81523_c0_g1_i1:23-802(+)